MTGMGKEHIYVTFSSLVFMTLERRNGLPTIDTPTHSKMGQYWEMLYTVTNKTCERKTKLLPSDRVQNEKSHGRPSGSQTSQDM